MPDKTKKKKSADQAMKHAAPDPQVDLHETESLSAYNLNDDQVAFAKTLAFLTAYQIAHCLKASPDIAEAYTETALTTIASNTVLGGPPRVAEIQQALNQIQQLTKIANVLSPLMRLIGQNLMMQCALLARDLGETLQVATSLQRTQPKLLENLASLAEWSHEHHRATTSAHTQATQAAATLSSTH